MKKTSEGEEDKMQEQKEADKGREDEEKGKEEMLSRMEW